MKPLYLAILLLCVAFSSSAQSADTQDALRLFNRGRTHYEQGALDSALVIWTSIVDRKLGTESDVYGMALFNIPDIYWQQKNYSKAKEGYHRVLNSDLKDNTETGSLMEPHANYKHQAALALAGLAQREQDYTTTLQWLERAEQQYPYWGFEGSATNVSMKQADLLGWKTHILRKQNRQADAVRSIVTELIIAGRLSSFFTDSEDTLLVLVNKAEFKRSLDAGLAHLTVQQTTPNNWSANFTVDGLPYTIPLSKSYPPRNLPHYRHTVFVDEKQKVNQDLVRQLVKNTPFYQRLSE